jgi:FkbM family methyltransferase
MKRLTDRIVKLARRFDINPKVVLDIGCADAKQTIELTRHYYKAKFYCFEALKNNIKKAKANTQHLDYVHVINKVVSDKNGSCKFHYSPGKNKIGSILPIDQHPARRFEWEEKEIDCIRLDDWAKINNIESFDMVWMDANGGEWQVLRGMGDMIDTIQIAQIEVMYEDNFKNNKYANEVIDFLEEKEFKIVSNIPHSEGRAGDIICIKK